MQKKTKSEISKRYKTELCRSYMETGCCSYGDLCEFAHGKEELRTFNHHQKFRTVLCSSYSDEEFICYYGQRCRFSHVPLHLVSTFYTPFYRLPIFKEISPSNLDDINNDSEQALPEHLSQICSNDLKSEKLTPCADKNGTLDFPFLPSSVALKSSFSNSSQSSSACCFHVLNSQDSHIPMKNGLLENNSRLNNKETSTNLSVNNNIDCSNNINNSSSDNSTADKSSSISSSDEVSKSLLLDRLMSLFPFIPNKNNVNGGTNNSNNNNNNNNLNSNSNNDLKSRFHYTANCISDKVIRSHAQTPSAENFQSNNNSNKLFKLNKPYQIPQLRKLMDNHNGMDMTVPGITTPVYSFKKAGKEKRKR